MSAPDYLLIGHITADLSPDGRAAGGTVSYAARTAAAFGLRAAVVTSASPDEPLLDEITPYAEVHLVPAAQTTTFENIYGADGRVQFVRAVAAKLSARDVPAGWRAAPLVHLAPVADEVDPLTAQHFPDASVLLTPQGWLRRWDEDGRVRFKRWFERQALAAVNCVVFSEEDIAAAPDLEAAFAGAVEDVFVTRAERGGTHYHAGVPSQYDTPQVQMVHPTGAGDIFAAAVLASWYRLGSMKAAVPVAAALAAQSVTRVGLAGVPTPEAVAEALTAYHDRTHSV